MDDKPAALTHSAPTHCEKSRSVHSLFEHKKDSLSAEDIELEAAVNDPGKISEDSSHKHGSSERRKSQQDDGLEEQWVPAVDLSERDLKLVMLAVVLSLASLYLDAFILSPALPIIARDLSANNADYAWIASGDFLTMAISVPAMARASDIFGRRKIMIFAHVVFLLGLFISGFSISVAMLIAGRLILGVGMGGLIVVGNICVIDLFSPRTRGIHLSFIGTVSAISSATGPILGGVLSTETTWRWCFWINIPISVISFVVMLLFLKLPPPQKPLMQGLKEFDSLGILTITTSTTLFLVGLQLGGTSAPWASPTVICPIVVGVIALMAFIWVETSIAKNPLIPLSIFANISRSATVLVMVGQSMVSAGTKFFLILYFQLVFGVSPLISAVYLLPYAVGLSMVLPFIGWSIKKTGRYRLLIRIGASMITLGAGLLVDTKAKQDWPLIIIPQILLAVGVGLTYQSTTIAFQAQIKQKYGPAGQSAFQMIRSLSQLISIVLGQVVFQATLSSSVRGLENPQINGNLVDALTSGNTFAALSLIKNHSPQEISIIHHLLAASFQDMWIFYTVICFCALVISFGISDVEMV